MRGERDRHDRILPAFSRHLVCHPLRAGGVRLRIAHPRKEHPVSRLQPASRPPLGACRGLHGRSTSLFRGNPEGPRPKPAEAGCPARGSHVTTRSKRVAKKVPAEGRQVRLLVADRAKNETRTRSETLWERDSGRENASSNICARPGAPATSNVLVLAVQGQGAGVPRARFRGLGSPARTPPHPTLPHFFAEHVNCDH